MTYIELASARFVIANLLANGFMISDDPAWHEESMWICLFLAAERGEI